MFHWPRQAACLRSQLLIAMPRRQFVCLASCSHVQSCAVVCSRVQVMLVNFYQRPAARRVQGLLQALRCKASFVSRSVLRWRCHCHPLSIQYGWVRRVHCSHTCQAELQFVVIVRQTPRFHHPRIGGRNPAIATAADKSRVSVQAPCHPGSECEEFVGFSASKNAAARTSSSNPAMNIDNS